MLETCVNCAHNHNVHCDIHNCSLRLINDGKHGCTYWQPKEAICYQRCGNCTGFEFTTLAMTWGVCNVAHVRREIHKNTYACEYFYREDEENVPKKTYYTKCGRQFEKNSTAVVTGYTIDFEDPQNEVCTSCPFKKEITDGWGANKRFLRWECRAGSEPPNHKTEWVGSLDDKNSIHIHSLDYDLLEEILQFCENHPELSAAYNADSMADCRMTLAVHCSPNKKGIAAKKKLIDKFFPKTETVPDEEFEVDEQKCRICGCTDSNGCYGGCYWVQEDLCSACACDITDCPFNDSNGGCCYENDKNDCDTEEFHQDVIKAVEKHGCEKENVQLDYNIIKDPDSCDVPNPEAEEEIKEDTALEVSKLSSINGFDYSSVDTETAEFLQEKANRITEIRIKSVIAIGKELAETFEKFSKLPYGNKTEMFDDWCESIGITSRTARNYISAYEYVAKNFRNIEEAEQIQPSLLFAISKPSAPKELQEAVISGDITTHKQYQELLKKYQDAESRAQQAEERAQKENEKWYREVNAASMAKAKALELEGKVKILEQQLEQAKRNGSTEKLHELGQKIKEYQEEIKGYREEIGRLNKQLSERPIEAAATRVIERYPEYEVNQTTHRLYGILLSAKNISDEEIRIMCQGDIHRREAILEFMEDLLKRIPEMIQLIYKYANIGGEDTNEDDNNYCS